ncbi:MAG TPA: MFS transporter [Ktedonobacterales bacterium]|nr:MFS transporter [Ktedonobacterales bacterium]
MKSNSTTTIDEIDDHTAPQRFLRERLTWASYWMLGYFAFLEAILGPLMLFIRSDLRLSYTLASLHFSAFALGAVVMGIFADRLTRRWGRRAAFWGGGIGMAAGALLVALSPVAASTILGAFMMGLLGGLLIITLQAALADRHQRFSSVALTEANVFASGFAFLAPLLVGLVTGAELSWRLALFPILALLVVTGLRYWSVPFPEHAAAHHEPAKAAGGRARLPLAYWAFWLLIALETGAEWSVVYWGASFLASDSPLSKADAATAMAAFFLAMLIGRIIGSRLTRAFPGLLVLATSLGIALVGFPLFWLVPLPLVRVMGLFIVGLGLANVYPLGVALATGAAPGQADRASARLSVAAGLSALIAPFILGALADHIGIGQAFGIAIPLLLLALLAAGLVRRGHTVAPA